MSKAQFAEYKGVHPSAVSHWIRLGKIYGPALVGRGRLARIVTDVADLQLAERLDPGQALSNSSALAGGSAAPAGADGAGPSHQDRYQAARADQAEMEAERARRRMAAEAGVYMETQAARAAWKRELGELLTAIELWLPELAEQVAAETGAERRAVAVLMKRAWRAFRARRSDEARSAVGTAPRLVAETGHEDASERQ